MMSQEIEHVGRFKYYIEKTDLENVRLEKRQKEEGAQFAHPVPEGKGLLLEALYMIYQH